MPRSRSILTEKM